MKFQPTILRPPHADELAYVGTIREQNPIITYHGSFQNPAYYRDDRDERVSSSQQWIELQPPPPPPASSSSLIHTSQLLPADYEIHSYPTDDYPSRQYPPRPTIIDYRPYRNDFIDDDDEIENYRLQSLPRPELILPEIQRTDTSTESFSINYPNTTPKSILKSSTNLSPSPGFSSTSYLQIQDSRPSSKTDESPRTSVKINTDQSIPINYPINVMQKPLLSRQDMKFANINQLNDIEWEVPREFRTIHSNREQTPPTTVDPKTRISWQNKMNISQSQNLTNNDITQQQAFEY